MKKRLEGNLIFAPLPVLMIGTYDENGVPNLMNAAWGGQCGRNEICISLSSHKTTDNLAVNPEFTVAFATLDTMKASDYFGLESGRKADKISKAGFHAVRSEKVNAPVFEEYPLTLECRVLSFENGLLFGEVVGMVADENVIDENGKVDLAEVRPISFDPAKNKYRLVGEIVGNAFADGAAFK